MGKSIFRRFGVRVTAAIVLSMSAVVIISGVMIYQFTFRAQFESTRQYLKSLAQTAAMTINTEHIAQIPLNNDGINTQAYSIVSDHLKKIKAANPQLKYIYILTKTDDTHIWKFVVDEYEKNRYTDGSSPGTSYNAGRFQEMLKGFNEPSADRKIEVDEWGKTLSGYAPLRDAGGRPIAVLGVDIDAQDVYMMQRHVVIRTIIVLVSVIMVALVLGFLISQRVTQPVARLIASTRYIGEGNLHHQVSIPGDDEISELADAFNDMAKSLLVSRRQLLTYFFDTVKSMIKVLEIRDHYTLGHSESVASYARDIATQMGIEPKTIEMFHNVCLLHDLGKVGVRDEILLKPDKLTDQEWQIIKLHPVWGEQILKPILQDPLMMAVIRNHHERYDGQGYPDGLKQEQIPLLVAIATVADSYDAMTTTRSYRKAMSKEEAVEQLLKNRGSQFHPEVVDAFIAVLKKKEKNA